MKPAIGQSGDNWMHLIPTHIGSITDLLESILLIAGHDDLDLRARHGCYAASAVKFNIFAEV